MLSSVTGNSVRRVVRKAEDTVVDRQAEPTPAIKNVMIMSTVKVNGLLQPNMY